MSMAPAHPKDPIGWCTAIALAFFALVLVRLSIPSAPYFDEVHYLPAAQSLLALDAYPNREHPLVGKELIAAGMALFGDRPLGWRIFPAIFGAIALFASCRALWFASLSRFATVACALLLASGFLVYIHSRIAMLDIFMASFCAIAAWQFSGAMREPETGRKRLIFCGIALGLAMGSKWNAIPFAVLPGIAFLVLRLRATGLRFVLTSRGAPVPGVTLIEAAVWLGLLPLLVYWATYLPVYLIAEGPMAGQGFFALQQEMLGLQESVLEPHPYQSIWADWIVNRRAIWYLYENVDGAQRGVVLIGNPLTMLLGLPALVWCAWTAVTKHSRAEAGAVTIFVATLGLWLFAAKPVQFYYHYLLPSFALLAALALALDRLRQSGWGWLSWVVLAGSLGVFAWFYPIVSAAPLSGPQSFNTWMWLDSWR